MELFQRISNSFRSILKPKKKYINKAEEVAYFRSFIENSISYLDLELCQFRDLRNKFSTTPLTKTMALINAEEKCHAPSQNVLYSLYLEWPKRCEKNQTSVDESCYYHFLNEIIDRACKDSDHASDRKEKVLRWLIKFFDKPKSEYRMSYNVVNHYSDCLHHGYKDLEFVKECLNKFGHDWVFQGSIKTNPKRVTNFFYQLSRTGRRMPHLIMLKERCLLHLTFLYTEDLLKFESDPLNDLNVLEALQRFVYFKGCIFLPAGRSAIPRFFKNLNGLKLKKGIMILHLYWVYIEIRSLEVNLDGDSEDDIEESEEEEENTEENVKENKEEKNKETIANASKSLRLLWNGVQIPFLSLRDMVVFKGVHSKREIAGIYDLYSKAIGEYHECVEPRSLKHLCRANIREILWINNDWLPDAIEQTDLPEGLKEYLNLKT